MRRLAVVSAGSRISPHKGICPGQLLNWKRIAAVTNVFAHFPQRSQPVISVYEPQCPNPLAAIETPRMATAKRRQWKFVISGYAPFSHGHLALLHRSTMPQLDHYTLFDLIKI